MRREDARLSLRVERDDVKRLRLHAGDFHARRSDRHARNRNADNLGPFFEQPLKIGSRYVTFNDVAIDDGCVARLGWLRNLALRLERGERLVVQLGDASGEAGSFEMLDPVAAAPSRRRFVDFHDRLRGALRHGFERGQREQTGDECSAFHCIILSDHVSWRTGATPVRRGRL